MVAMAMYGSYSYGYVFYEQHCNYVNHSYSVVQYGIRPIIETGDCKGVKKYSLCHQKTTYLLMQVITGAKQISKIRRRGGLVPVMVNK